MATPPKPAVDISLGSNAGGRCCENIRAIGACSSSAAAKKGATHVAFGLSDAPFTLFDGSGISTLHPVGHCIVGGASLSLTSWPSGPFQPLRETRDQFQRVVSALSSTNDAPASSRSGRTGRLSLAQLAVDAGYSDQAPLCRDFVAFAGVSPSVYLRLAPAQPNHVQLPQRRQ